MPDQSQVLFNIQDQIISTSIINFIKPWKSVCNAYIQNKFVMNKLQPLIDSQNGMASVNCYI